MKNMENQTKKMYVNMREKPKEVIITDNFGNTVIDFYDIAKKKQRIEQKAYSSNQDISFDII
jgi:hypothetical protein